MKKKIGPHVFEDGAITCLACGASKSGALLDERGTRTKDGGHYCAHPDCLPVQGHVRRAWERWRGPVHTSTAVVGLLSVLATFGLFIYLIVLAARG